VGLPYRQGPLLRRAPKTSAWRLLVAHAGGLAFRLRARKRRRRGAAGPFIDGETTRSIAIACVLLTGVVGSGVYVRSMRHELPRAPRLPGPFPTGPTLITLSSEGGLGGGGDGTFLSIDENGWYVTSCERGGWEKDLSRAVAQLPTAERTQLKAEIAAVDWPSLKSDYGVGGGDDIWDDVITHVESRWLSVLVEDGQNLPAPLRDLHTHLHRLYENLRPAHCRPPLPRPDLR